MMTIENFEQQISEVILERGDSYFKNNHVSALEESEPGIWIAEVTGTEIYMVSVRITNGEIAEWDCDCPFEGEICKHVTALLYAIADEESINKKSTTTKIPPKKKANNTETIFRKTTKEELTRFLISQFSRYHGLKNTFISYFAELIDEDSESKYKIIVKNIIKGGEDKYGFVDYRSARHVTVTLSELLNKADSLLEKKNIVESLTICKTLIEEVPSLSQSMDDSGGGITDLLEYAFDIFLRIVEKVPPELKDALFKYCLDEYPKAKYHDIDYQNSFLRLLPELITLETQEKQFLKLIDDQIEKVKGLQYYEHQVPSLIKFKIDYFQKNNHQTEAWKLIEDNKQYPNFMEMMIDKEIKNKEYEKAITLCQEGIKIAETKSHPGTVNDWNEKLLEIYEKTNDLLKIREMTEKLFFRNYFNMTYYKKLKSTYQKNEWTEICTKIIEKIKGQSEHGSYAHASTLANIFIEEKYKDRLLKLLQINSKRISLVDEYAGHLKEEYSAEILLLYEEGIKIHALNPGRNIYNEVAHYLKKLKKIEGGQEKMVLPLIV